jgi:hypothetical protein
MGRCGALASASAKARLPSAWLHSISRPSDDLSAAGRTTVIMRKSQIWIKWSIRLYRTLLTQKAK